MRIESNPSLHCDLAEREDLACDDIFFGFFSDLEVECDLNETGHHFDKKLRHKRIRVIVVFRLRDNVYLSYQHHQLQHDSMEDYIP
jgi:hypothetical protein